MGAVVAAFLEGAKLKLCVKGLALVAAVPHLQSLVAEPQLLQSLVAEPQPQLLRVVKMILQATVHR
jgi:hypothetical protein